MNLLEYLVGGVFVSIFIGVTARSFYLRWWGIATTGIIVAFEIDTSGEENTYKPVVAFTTLEGMRVEAKSADGRTKGDTYLNVGDAVTLRYAARNPTCFTINNDDVSVVLLTFFAALFVVLGIWMSL